MSDTDSIASGTDSMVYDTDSMVDAIASIARSDAITLVIPDSTETSGRWAPYHHTPSIVMTRVHPASYMELPKPDLIVQQAPTDSPALILGDTYGFSFPNAIYQAETKDASGLVALVVDLLHYSPGERTLVVPEICHTFHIYDKELVPLQGRCVPRFAGLFGHGSLYCAVFEDAGDRITYEEREQKEIRIEIIQAILEIEQAKVGPVLNQWRFIRRGQDGRIKIVPESVVSLGKYQSMPAPPGDSRSPEERITEVCKGRKHSAHEIFEVYERDDDPKYIWCCDWS